MSSSLFVLVPSYRPAPSIVRLVHKLAKESVFDGVIVIDDGSGPAYRHLFDAFAGEPRIEILRHETNLGKGAALKRGMSHALSKGSRLLGVVTADGDGQHLVHDICRVARRLRRAPEHLVLGARDLDGRVPLRSRIGNAVTRVVFRTVVGRALRDTQTGLRGIPAHLVKALLPVPFNRYEFEMEMLVLSTALNVPFLQEPIATVYEDGNTSSHFDPVMDSARIYARLARYAVTSRSAHGRLAAGELDGLESLSHLGGAENGAPSDGGQVAWAYKD